MATDDARFRHFVPERNILDVLDGCIFESNYKRPFVITCDSTQ